MNGTPAAAETSSRGRAIQAVRRLGWGVADQGISSLSNFALGLFVARTFGASSFGAFSLAFVTYTVVINAARGLATDPFMVRYSGAMDRRWRRGTSSATGTALAVGLVSGILCILAGLVLPDPVGPAFVAVGVGLPGLVLQDSWRFVFFAGGRGASAFVNDLSWTVLLVSTLLVIHNQGVNSEATCLLIFGATGTLAAVLGGLQARVLPRPHRTAYWLRSQHALSYRYLVENVSISGAAQLRSFVLGAVAGLAAVGYVRASEILMGPFFIVLSGISQVAVPEASRVFHQNSRRLLRFCLVLSSIQAAGALAWGVVLMTVFPLGLGPVLLKEVWPPTAQLLPAITLTVVAVSFVNAAAAGLRAMGVSRRSLRAQLTASVTYVVCASIGAVLGSALGASSSTGPVLGSALGASWGVTVAQFVSTIVWWHQLRAALADHHSKLPTANGTARALHRDQVTPVPVTGRGAPPPHTPDSNDHADLKRDVRGQAITAERTETP